MDISALLRNSHTNGFSVETQVPVRPLITYMLSEFVVEVVEEVVRLNLPQRRSSLTSRACRCLEYRPHVDTGTLRRTWTEVPDLLIGFKPGSSRLRILRSAVEAILNVFFAPKARKILF